MQQRSAELQNENERPQITFDCDACKDTGSILVKVTEAGLDGKEREKDVFRPCDCMEKKHLQNRFKNALIPEEFLHARLDTYERETDVQKMMYDETVKYLQELPQIMADGKKANSFGFIAYLGESIIKQLRGQERADAIQEHNNFGLGKTHLQIAAAKVILNKMKVRDKLPDGRQSAMARGCRVLIVRDTVMTDLINAKRSDDGGEEFYKLLNGLQNTDVLIWDDLGKSKWTETKEDLYYQVINARYLNNKPIIFSSNEDRETLEEKIGFAAADRLLNGMCRGRLFEVEGESYRGREDE